jgi:hypothetical protein
MSSEETPFGRCPLPINQVAEVLMGHGSGGKLSAKLIENLILPAFRNPELELLDDQAVFSVGGARLAFTTDSYVVTPIFFPGGDIGDLAVNGTVNDLAMGGAQPLYLSLAFILEEGLPLADLERVVESARRAARRRADRNRRYQGRRQRQRRQDFRQYVGDRRGSRRNRAFVVPHQARRRDSAVGHDWRPWHRDPVAARGVGVRRRVAE